MTLHGFDAAGEFDRQLRTLLDRGYHRMAGLDGEDFAGLLAPLRATAAARAGEMAPPDEGRAPFVLVVTRELAAPEQAVTLTTLAGRSRPGIVDRHFAEGELVRFVPVKGIEIPDARAYLLFGIERGEEFCGAVPEDAMAAIAGRGRTLLTVEEGVALVTHFPEVLAKNKCFSLGGSRCGDRRVPAIWISANAPKLGWCWAGNPHTWLGMASAAGRDGTLG
ncbi:DUF5701 family protein [Actinomadura viridis]|uniref:Uncharacterized protein n=1 Tax=Actinomadura viridis TaxID=58110 RepID=A0A931GV11_9ACTN|nr:DUF5701 family protein [Actinomadura viridis]MBG6093754.1 hypothetical protein [Actinomadura viridis]